MQVMHDRVLIKKIEQDKTTASGLVLAGIPDVMFEATVIAVGPGKPVKDSNTFIPLTVKVGNRVLYNPGATITVNVGGETLLVTKEEDIFAIMDAE
jgi:chaperonin GroES